MTIKDLKENGLFRFKINLGEFFDVPPEDVYLVLGEPTMKEYDRIQKKAETSADDMVKMMKGCLLEHNIESREGVKATSEEVISLLNEFPAALTEALQAWQDELPLVKRSREKSENSVPPPLES
jgi:hypothetical protein